MKKTALYPKHLALGAKMVEFAGFEMPVSYSGIIQEHEAVRQDAGAFDVSHMGEFIIEGDEALDLVQWITSNDVTKLTPGKAQYSCFPTPSGGIVDDLLVYQLDEKKYMLVVNASNITKDWNWIHQNNRWEKVSISDISDQTSLIALQGPKAMNILQKLTDVELENIKFYHFTTGTVAGKDDIIISATGYTGSGGFELYIQNESATAVWDAIFDAGGDDLMPAGLGARDTLRLEMGFCLYGNDIHDNTSPLEANLGWITKMKTDFLGKERLEEQKEAGLERKLVGLEIKGKGIPRQGYNLLNDSGEQIGIVTSGTQSPSLDKAIAMGYLKTPYAKEGTRVKVEARNKQLDAEVVKMPFYKS